MTTSASGQSGSAPPQRQNGVAAFDGFQRFQDRIARLGESVAAHPLDVADPDGDARQFRCVGVDLDTLDVGGADRGKGPLQTHRLRFQLHAVLDVLERVQRQMEKIARTAGGVEHREPPQPFEKDAQKTLRLRALPRLRRLRRRRPGLRQTVRDLRLRRLPFGEPGADDHRLDDHHDLVAVGIVRAKLRALVRVEAALEQRAQDRRVDLRPVERRGVKRGFDPLPVEGQGGVVVEQPAVEPGHGLEADAAPGGHRAEQVAGEVGELVRPLARLFQHPGEHVAGQKPRVLGEHAEHQTVDEMRHRLGLVAARPQALGEGREGRRRALRHRLARLARAKTLRVRHRPFELVAGGGVDEIVERELVRHAHAVGPVGADAEPRHVRDDQQRRVLQGERVLTQLVERRVEVGAPPLVLPGEAAALPHVGPAVAAGVLARAALEAVDLAGRVGLRRRRLAEQTAQVDEMLLTPRALLQRCRPPLGDERLRRHAVTDAARAGGAAASS